MSGARNYGDSVAREMSRRVGGAFEDTTALKALGPHQREHGMMAVVMADYSLWVFDAGADDQADDNVLVPDEGTGRWMACTLTEASGG